LWEYVFEVSEIFLKLMMRHIDPLPRLKLPKSDAPVDLVASPSAIQRPNPACNSLGFADNWLRRQPEASERRVVKSPSWFVLLGIHIWSGHATA
jgi:hypothetical protein